MDWPLVPWTGFENVHVLGRWDDVGAALIAEACGTGVWDLVVEFAEVIEWEDLAAN